MKAPLPKDWKRMPLDHIADVQTGIAKGKAINGAAVTLPYLRVANVQDGYVDLSVVKEITLKPSEVDRYSLRKGDVLFTEGGDFDKLGRGTVWNGEIEPCLHQNHVFAVRPNLDCLLSEFLSFQAACEYGRRYFQLSSKQSTNLASINSTQLKQFPVLLPPLLEQRKIAEILRTWDETIERCLLVIKLREKQFKGMLDLLINWEFGKNRPLRDVLSSVSRQVPRPDHPYRALSIRSHGKGTFERFVENPESVAMDQLFVAKAGDLIVNITFAWEGAIALIPDAHDGGLVSHRFPMFEPNMKYVNPRYLRHVVRTPRFTFLLGIISPGGAGRNRVLNKHDFLELEIPLPALTDQDQIAEILDDAEHVIAAERQRLDSFQRQKRGLMQKLLTGKWRVRVE